MRQVLAINPLASAIRYGPFFAGYWNSLVSLAQGAKHWGSEFGAETTLGGAALANPAESSATTAAAIRVRYGIRASCCLGKCGCPSPRQQTRLASFSGLQPDAGVHRCQHTFGHAILQMRRFMACVAPP